MGIDETPYITRSALIGDELSDTCWIGSPWKWVGFMIPIYLCILLNIVLFVMVARIIIKAGKQGSSHGHAREFKALLSISVTACLPWVIASLTSISFLAQAFQWLFIIVTGLQGPVMFICFVIFQEDVVTNLFKLAGQTPPEFLIPPKSSKATPSKSAASSAGPVTKVTIAPQPAASTPVKQVEPVQQQEEKKEEENIYSKVDDKEDKKSVTNLGDMDTAAPIIPCISRDTATDKDATALVIDTDDVTYENTVATAAEDTEAGGGDISAASYPHVPQLV